MNLSCGVVRDLLPLYAENLTTEETNALMREHLAACEACSAELKKLQQPMAAPTAAPSSGDNALKLVRKGIRARRVTAVLFAALLVFVAMLTVFSRMVRPQYISYRDSGVAVVISENGDVTARFSGDVTSCKVTKSVDEAQRTVVEVEAWTSLWDRMLGKTTPSVLLSSNAEKADVVYYCDLSTEHDNMTVLYGTAPDGGSAVLPQLVLGMYFVLALAAAVVLGLLWLLLRKNKTASRILGYLFAAPLSYVLGHLLMTTEFVSFSATSDFITNCIAALALYGVLVLGMRLILQHKQDAAVQK